MNLYENIKRKREELRMTQAELAVKTGYADKTMISKIEKGVIDLPQSKIQLFADALNTTPRDLMGWTAENKAVTKTKIPVLGRVAAGIPIDAIEDVLDWEEIPSDLASTGEFFGLKIKGHSMEPRIADGDVVIVHCQPDAESGDVVVVQVNGDHATCKKLSKHESGISLISFNPAYDPINFSNDQIESLPVTIIGKVVENRQKY